MSRPKKETLKRKTTYIETDPLEVPESFKRALDSEDKTYRWIRVLTPSGDYDHKNVGKRMREGWEFVKESDFDPEDPFMYSVDVRDVGRLNGVVTIGDVALAIHFKEFVQDRNEKLTNRGRELERALDLEIKRQKGNAMPLDSVKNEVSETLGNRQVSID
jgi:hypothetical protein